MPLPGEKAAVTGTGLAGGVGGVAGFAAGATADAAGFAAGAAADVAGFGAAGAADAVGFVGEAADDGGFGSAGVALAGGLDADMTGPGAGVADEVVGAASAIQARRRLAAVRVGKVRRAFGTAGA